MRTTVLETRCRIGKDEAALAEAIACARPTAKRGFFPAVLAILERHSDAIANLDRDLPTTWRPEPEANEVAFAHRTEAVGGGHSLISAAMITAARPATS